MSSPIGRTSTERFNNLTDLLNYHLRVHRGIGLGDIYKLAHQSVFGPEHLGEAASEEAIFEEMHSPDIEFEEPLLEPISVGGGACRINLRVACKQGISPALIAEAMQRSMGKFSRSIDDFACLWAEVGDCLRNLQLEFGGEEYEELTRRMREKGFTPLHHSSLYRKYNWPAYRVLMKGEFERLKPLPSSVAR